MRAGKGAPRAIMVRSDAGAAHRDERFLVVLRRIKSYGSVRRDVLTFDWG